MARRLRRYSAGIVLPLLGVYGCGALEPLHRPATVAPLRTWTETAKRTAQAEVKVAAHFEAGNILIQATRVAQCAEDSVNLTETQTTDHYGTNWAAAGPILGGAAVGLGLGGFLIGTAGGRPPFDDPFSRGELSREGSYGLGAPLLAAGVGLAAAGIYAIARAHDESQPPAVAREEHSGLMAACGTAPATGSAVVTLYGAGPLQVTLDARGQATVPVPSSAARIPSGSESWAHIAVEGAFPVVLRPPLAFVTAELTRAGTRSEIDEFRAYTGKDDLPKPLEERYKRLVADEEAEAARKGALVREAQAAWRAKASAAVQQAEKLGEKKHRWREALELLSMVPDPPSAGEAPQLEEDLRVYRGAAECALLENEATAHGRNFPPWWAALMLLPPGPQHVLTEEGLAPQIDKVFHEADIAVPKDFDVWNQASPIFVRAINIMGHGGLRVDVRFTHDPMKKGADACKGMGNFNPAFEEFAHDFCPSFWPRYVWYAVKTYGALQSNTRTPKARSALLSFNLRYMAVNVWTRTGDRILMVWEDNGTPTWYADAPSQVMATYRNKDYMMRGWINEMLGMSATDAGGKLTALGAMSRIAHGDW